jgi:hypothetical protein
MHKSSGGSRPLPDFHPWPTAVERKPMRRLSKRHKVDRVGRMRRDYTARLAEPPCEAMLKEGGARPAVWFPLADLHSQFDLSVVGGLRLDQVGWAGAPSWMAA